MTDRFKNALDEYNSGLYPHTEGRFAQANFVSDETVYSIREAITLATESEQIRKRLAELENLLAQANKKIKWYERTEATND